MLGLVVPAILSGLTTGAVYALVALGLTLIYGVLHIINFAHGSLLMAALYVALLLNMRLGLDPYVALPIVVVLFFCAGYLLQRYAVDTFSHGRDANILLVTLAISIIIDNGALYLFTSNTRTIEVPYAFEMVEIGPAFIPLPKVVAFGAALLFAALLWAMMRHTRLGAAIRAVAIEKRGAELMGIDVKHTYAMCFGIGTACVGAAACLLLPTFYVTPQVGYAFVLVSFTTVVLGGMGSLGGALVAGLLLGVIEALCGLFLGETLGQIGIFAAFILTLLLRPAGLFAPRAA